MNIKGIFDMVKPLLPDILPEEPMAKHTTFRIGGPAEVLARPQSTEELIQLWAFCHNNHIPITVLGDGSNVLVSDKGIRGVVIVTNKMNAITVHENSITAQTGVRLAKLADTAASKNLSGLAFASGIPGTVGGAVFMNAGAYEHAIHEVCESVTLLKIGESKPIFLPKAQMEFGYRKSIVQQGGWLILEAEFQLQPGDETAIRAIMTELNGKRRQSQPLEFPSAGSTFKRPKGYYAGKLISDSGLKGFSIGGAQVSEKHAGFVINKGGASAKDVLDLMEAVRQKVHKNYGVWLEPEVQIIGE